MPPPHPPAFHVAPFLTTRWTLVRLAQADSEDGRRALTDLCDAYYEPVVAFLRCSLRDADAAREMSHAFFAEMLAGGTLRTADEERGRFRFYLLGAVKHFAARQREASMRWKRGGGAIPVPMHHTEAMGLADGSQLSPDAEFDRQWAVTVLARGLDALRRACEADGKATLFAVIQPLLTGDAAHGDQAFLAEECRMTVESFRMAVHRLRKRLRECVKAEIASTLDDPAMVQAEMQALFAALGG